MSIHEQIKEHFEAYLAEHDKWEEKGVKAAATRARKALGELGKLSKMYHQDVIKQILHYKFENVILCGNLFKSLLKKMKTETDQINCLLDENEIMQFLKKNIHNNDIILIKGSNSTKVNKLANMLNANKE